MIRHGKQTMLKAKKTLSESLKQGYEKVLLTFLSRLAEVKFLLVGDLNCIRIPGLEGLFGLMRSVTSAT